MNQQYIDLFDRFTHGALNRREFFERLSVLAGSAAAASAVLPVLENNYAHAAMVAEDDPRLQASMQAIGDKIGGYLALPKGLATKTGGVIVIHENRGLNPHIKDVARRVALEGFIAFAPDYLHAMGGTPQDADKARDMIGTLKPEDNLATSRGSLAGLAKHPLCTGRIGAVGFCWGGGQVNALAVADPLLAGGVAYYGSQPKSGTENIKAALLLHYAALDERINAGIAAYEEALKATQKTYELHIYEGANHAFNNDTNEARYNKEAAELAWGRTIGFLKKHCGPTPA